MRKKVAIPLIVALIALVVLVVLLRRNTATGTDVKYQTASVTKGTLISSVEGTGNIAVANSATVNPTVAGTVTQVKVAVGDVVKKGQTLYYIDDDGQLDTAVTKSGAAVDQSKQSLESSRTALLQAQNDVTVANDANTEKSGTVSDAQLTILAQKVVAAQSKVTSDTQNLASAEADYTYQKKNAGKRLVTAPIAGTVTAVAVHNGDAVTLNGTAASIVIDDLSSLQTTVSINEIDASKVAVGQKAAVTFDAVEDLTLAGKVTAVSFSGTVTQGVVTYNATIGFDQLDPRVRPSMTATASITTAVKTDVLLVPSTAVKSDTTGSYVELLENGSPRQQVVTVGASNDTDTEVTAGLTEGQTVVTGTVSAATTTTATTGNSSASTGARAGGGEVRSSFGVPF